MKCPKCKIETTPTQLIRANMCKVCENSKEQQHD
jgi:hypothetical protein